MAQKQALGPTDVAVALIEAGKLMVIDGRGIPWTFEAGQTDAAGNEIPGPDSVTTAFVLNERLHALSGNVIWTYYPGSGWVEGHEIDTTVEGEGEGPWTKGRPVETRVVKEEDEVAPKSRKKAKEHA